MPRIKIARIHITQQYYGDYVEDYTTNKAFVPQTDWDQVTNEELKMLKKHLPQLGQYNSKYEDYTFCIFEELEEEETQDLIKTTVADFKNSIIKLEKQKEEAKKKAEKTAKEKAEKKKQKDIEKLKKQLKEHPELLEELKK